MFSLRLPRFRRFGLLPGVVLFVLPPPAFAQAAPTPPDSDEDLEVPATAAPAPKAAAPSPAAQVKPAASAQPATPPAAKPESPVAVAPPVGAASATGSSALTVSGYLHAQYQHSAASEDQLNASGQPLNEDELVLRRARLRFDRTWDFAAATLELDANTVRGATVGIRRAEASLFYRGKSRAELPPVVGLAAGVIDLPFGYELTESTRDRVFMERSLASSALFPTEMDAGARVFGGYSFLRYAVAVSNGQPVDRNGLPHDPNAAKDVTGRIGAEGQLSGSLKLAGGSSFASGKGFHSGQPARKSVIRWRDDNEDGSLQPSEIIATPGSGATPSSNFERWVLGVDLSTSLRTPIGTTTLWGEAYVATNYDRGYAPADPVTLGTDVREAGGYVALAQELGRYGLVGFRASLYDPNSDVIEVHADKSVPKTQTVRTYSALGGLVLPGRARLSFQYDVVRDYLGRNAAGVPVDAKNDRWTLRLGVDL